MKRRVAVVGAGVSGLTCAVLFAEEGFEAAVLAEEIGDETNSAAAAAIWYPYDVGASSEVVPWALISYGRFLELARNPESGVSLIELRVFSRLGPIAPPDWAQPFATRLSVPAYEIPPRSRADFSIHVPLIETGEISRVSQSPLNKRRRLDHTSDPLQPPGGNRRSLRSPR